MYDVSYIDTGYYPGAIQFRRNNTSRPQRIREFFLIYWMACNTFFSRLFRGSRRFISRQCRKLRRCIIPDPDPIEERINDHYFRRYKLKLNCKGLNHPKLTSMKRIKKGQYYCIEHVTPYDRLSFVLSGKFAVMKEKKVSYEVYRNEFLDTEEFDKLFFLNSLSKKTIVAIEDSTLVYWEYPSLMYILERRQHLVRALAKCMNIQDNEVMYRKQAKDFDDRINEARKLEQKRCQRRARSETRDRHASCSDGRRYSTEYLWL